MSLHHRVGRGLDDVVADGSDTNLLTRIIDQRMTVIAQQLHHDPKLKVENLLGLDNALTERLWRLDLESVQRLRGMLPLMQNIRFIPLLASSIN